MFHLFFLENITFGSEKRWLTLPTLLLFNIIPLFLFSKIAFSSKKFELSLVFRSIDFFLLHFRSSRFTFRLKSFIFGLNKRNMLWCSTSTHTIQFTIWSILSQSRSVIGQFVEKTLSFSSWLFNHFDYPIPFTFFILLFIANRCFSFESIFEYIILNYLPLMIFLIHKCEQSVCILIFILCLGRLIMKRLKLTQLK